MAAPASIDALLELGCKSGLLETGALESWRAAKDGLQSPGQCADALVRDGLLTPFQAEKLLGGRWRGFLIISQSLIRVLGKMIKNDAGGG